MSYSRLASTFHLVLTGVTSTLAALVMLFAAQSSAKAIDCNSETAIREHLTRNAQAASQRDREPLECSAAAIAPLTSIIEVETDRPLRLAALAALGRIGFEMQLDETVNLSRLEETTPFLLEIVQNPSEDERIREGAACALRSVSTDSNVTVPQLLELFETELDRVETELDLNQTLLGTIVRLIDRQQLSYCIVYESETSGDGTEHEREISDQTIDLVVTTLARLLEKSIEENPDSPLNIYSDILRVLGSLGEEALPAIPAMLAARGHFVTSDASRAIARIGTPALPFLFDYFEAPPGNDPDRRNFQRRRVLRILGDMASLPADQILPFYLEILQSPTSTQAQQDIVLSNLVNGNLANTSAELLPLYLDRLRTRDIVSTDLIRAIASFGADAAQAVPDFLRLLESTGDVSFKEEEVFFKKTVIESLSRLGQIAAEEGIPVLVELLKTSDEANLREAAAAELGQIASDGINPQLANLNEEEREVAEAILGAFSGGTFTLPDDPPIAANLDLPNVEMAIAALFQAFEQDPEATVTLAAARSLGEIGVSNPAFVSALLARAEASSNEYGFIRVLTDLFNKTQDPRLLGANEGETDDTLMRLIRLVEQDNCDAVFTLKAALRLAPSPSAAVTDALVGTVNRDLCPDQGLVLILSEIEITSETAAVLSPLIDLAAQEDFDAIFALGSIGPDAEVAVPTIVQVAQTSTDWTSRSGAIHALGRIGTSNPDAIRFLQENLQNPDTASTHAVSALSLGLIGSPAQDALPALVERLESVATQADDPDFDSYIPRYSANAIASIIQEIMLLSPELPQDERAQLGRYIERSLTAINALPPEFARLKAPLQDALAATLP